MQFSKKPSHVQEKPQEFMAKVFSALKQLLQRPLLINSSHSKEQLGHVYTEPKQDSAMSYNTGSENTPAAGLPIPHVDRLQ